MAALRQPSLDVREARRLALARAGLLNPAWTDMPSRGQGSGKRALRAADAVIRRFGYLQLDTVSISGARSHAIVLLSRIEGMDRQLPEQLLRPGRPLFEYWAHEACWLPIELYPVFAFRRQRLLGEYPRWGELVSQNREVADGLLRRIGDEGPLRSVDLEGAGSRGWWDLKLSKQIATGLWLSGELAIRERRAFQRSYDLTERVIPERWLRCPMLLPEALRTLLLGALCGHGWATTGTLAATWRLRNLRPEIGRALGELEDAGEIVACSLRRDDGGEIAGWIRPADLDLARRLRRVRPRRDRGVLLSPFDPVLWDRARVRQLFDFEQVLEIFKPAAQRKYGYYCLPVLAGDRLVGRFDLKAHRRRGRLEVLSCLFEDDSAATRAAAADALVRFAEAVELTPGDQLSEAASYS